jgi:16S rRNA (uracil1498-N3)-methyltransferase
MNLFYSPHISGDSFTLDEAESKHAVRVLRLRTGDTLYLVDGRGGWFEAAIQEDHPKACRLTILSHIPDYKPLPYHLHLAVSPTKNMDRFEWFLEKATEIGISEITPLRCHRTERSRINHERLERILVSAMKQSLKAYKPVLNEVTTLGTFLAKDRVGTLGIAHLDSSGNTGLTALPRNSTYTLLVGPEGDFTDEEVKEAMEAGYPSFHLGSSRLRTETAAVYITTAVSLLSTGG